MINIIGLILIYSLDSLWLVKRMLKIKKNVYTCIKNCALNFSTVVMLKVIKN